MSATCTAVSASDVTETVEVLPPYTPEELTRIAFAHVDRYFSLPEEAREDAASAFVLAALEAERRARPGAGLRSYQYRAGLWAAGQFVRDWGEQRNNTPVSIDLVSTLRGGESQEEESGDSAESVLAPPSQNSDPLDGLIREEEMNILQAALGKLPLRHQDALRMHFEDGLTMDQVGKRMGVSKVRAFQIITAATEKLREILPDGIGLS